MKLAVKFSVVVLALLFLGGFGMWFWTLGAVASESVPPMRIEVTKAPVELKRKDDATWKALEMSTDVQVGDSIRTGEGGLAEIRWGDRGVSRIDPSSELTIEAIPQDEQAATNAVIRLSVSGGRVWTRLLKLLDMSSEAQVTTGNVVATVRGTAFGVASNDGTDIAVTESVVAAGAKDSKNRTLVREGRLARFHSSGTVDILRDLTDEDAWAKENKKADAAFDEALRREVEERFKKRQKPAPEWLVDLAERARLASTNDEKENERLRTGYARRRLADAIERPELADRTLSRLPDLKGDPDDVLRDIRLAVLVTRRQPDRRLTDALQNLRLDLLDVSEAERRYALALDIDDHIDDVIFPFIPLSEDERARIIQSLLNDISEWEKGNEGVTGDDRTRLDEKAAALRERLFELGMPLPTTEPLPDSTTSTESGASTSTAPTEPTPTEPKVVPKTDTLNTTSKDEPAPATAPAPKTCGYTRVSMFAKPNSNVSVGAFVSLTLFATCPDGTTDDVTGRATFSSGYTSDGRISGATFIPSRDGTISLFGTIQENGKTLSANTSITVNKVQTGKRLTGVTATATGPTSLTTGQGAPVQGYAHYSDGTKSEVTYQCVWSTSDARMGMVSSQRFQSLSGVGTVSAICSYTEGGVTLKGSVTFTISLDPSLTPDSGGCIYDPRKGTYCP